MKKFLVLSVVISLAFSACAKKEASYEIAYGGSICGSPISIASINSYYANEGLKVDLVSGASFETIRSYLAAGKMPVINGDFQFFPSIYEGVDVKLISGLHEGCIKILVPNDSPIKTIADLRGKQVAVDEIGGTPMAVASVAAGAAGITDPKNEIIWLPFPGDQEVQAVETGKADAVAAWDPIATMAEETGKYRTLLDIATDPLFAGRNCCFLFASGKLLKENPKVVAGVLRAINKAVAYEGEFPEDAAALLVKEKKVATDDEGLVARLLKSFHFEAHHTQESNISAKDDAIYFAQKLTEIGYLPADLDVQKFVDDMYVDVFALEAAAGK
ncbi:MAG: ABC transporter substrate-binding protein [Termitinemataceae bacterium]|nr:MAG: ABC transporter substrate-binding protein [Termitinemataceae bacterium]